MIKPDIQRLLRQALRSVGSGCATQTDVDFVWQDVQSMVIRDMMTKDNLRTDGRGLIDSRPASYQVNALLTSPLSSGVFCPACYVPTLCSDLKPAFALNLCCKGGRAAGITSFGLCTCWLRLDVFCVQPFNSLPGLVRAHTAWHTHKL